MKPSTNPVYSMGRIHSYELDQSREREKRLTRLVDYCRVTLKTLAGCIHRDTEVNRCWLAGHGTHVFLVEQALKQFET